MSSTDSQPPAPRTDGVADTTSSDAGFMAFRVGRYTLLSSLDLIEEVVDIMPLSSVPGTQRWFLGLGASRGRLLPVSDLAGFAGVGVSHTLPHSRLLVVGRQQQSIGLSVDEVTGLVNADQVSTEDEHSSSSAIKHPATRCRVETAPRLAPLVTTDLLLDGEPALLVDLTRLFDQPEFIAIGTGP